VGRRLSVLQWKHNAAWTTWCAAADTDTVDGFLLLRELQASEPPTIMTLIESQEPGREWMVCCGLRHHFELIYADGGSRSLHLEASAKPHLVAALDLCEDEEPELLLCYNSESESPDGDDCVVVVYTLFSCLAKVRQRKTKARPVFCGG
jgi:hypothetical protein